MSADPDFGSNARSSSARRLAFTAAAGIVSGLSSSCAERARTLTAVDIPTVEAPRSEVEPDRPTEPRHAEPVVAREDEPACDSCQGRNECKGRGNCKVEGQHDCKGKNDCKAKGGCRAGPCEKAEHEVLRTGPSNCCKGSNQCKGQGNCKTSQHGCKGINNCKGLGGCKPVNCP